MNMLWTPEIVPPQVDSTVTDKIISRVREDGLTKVYQDSVPLFELTQPRLREQIKSVAIDDLEDQRPIIVLRAAAVLTNYAYVESGYNEPICDEALVVGSMEAELEGVPTVYLASWHSDPELQRLIGTLLDTPEFQSGAAEYDYPKLLHIGAGCVRYYMQHSVAA